MFYIDTTTKKFTAGPQESTSSGECCYCCEGTDVPLFLRTKVMNPSLIQKPKLVHYQTAIIQLSLRDPQGFPYDLTDKELILAVDNTFQHSDSLIALSSDFLVLDAQQGIVQFTVKCSSGKFQKLVNNKIPASQVWMQITSYSPEDIQGTVILQDRGITLAPKLYTTEGIPQDNDPNYYNKQQTRAVIAAYIKLAQAQSDSQIQEALLEFIHQKFYNREDVDFLFGSLSDSFNEKLNGYYTSIQVDALLAGLSNSFNSKLQGYYNKGQVDSFIGTVNSSLEELSNAVEENANRFSSYYTKTQTDAIVSSLSNSITALDTKLQELHIEKAQTPAQGFAATYRLLDWQGNTKGDPINVLQDSTLKDMYYVEASQQDLVYDPSLVIGDPYLKLEFYTKGQQETTAIRYVPLKGLVDVYTAGDGLHGTQQFSIKLSSDAQTNKYLQVSSNGLAVKNLDSDFSAINGKIGELSNSITTVKNLFNGYYTKAQVNGIANALSDSIAAVRDSLNNYYTKIEVQQIASQLSDSIQGVKGTFGNYYTKAQVDAIVAGISDSVDLSNYYTKGAVDALVQGLSNSIQDVRSTFSNYYDKGEIDQLLSQLSNSVDLFNYYTKGQVDHLIEGISNSVDLSNYYTKAQTDAIAGALSDSIQAVKSSLTGYYTKAEVDAIVEGLSNSIIVLNGKFSSYYDKEAVDAITGALSDSMSAIRRAFGNYYTRGQVDQLIDSISNSVDLSNYYTKDQMDGLLEDLSNSFNGKLQGYYTGLTVDGLIGALSDSIEALRQAFSGYYTSGQVDDLIGQLSDSIHDIRATHYTKTQVDELLQNIPQIQGVVISFSQVTNNIATFTGINTVPVQVMTDKGSVYPVQKGSLQVDIQNASFTLDVTPYLVYDNSQAFTGTWRLYMAGSAPGSDSQDLSNYYTKGQTNSLIQGKLDAPSSSGSAGQLLVRGQQGIEWRDSFRHVLLQSSFFKPQNAVIYTYTPQQSDSIQFIQGTPGLFYLQFEMSSDSVTFQLPQMQWQGAPPAFTAGSDILVQVLYDGTTYRASSYPDLSDFARLSVDNQFTAGISVRGKFIQGYAKGSAEWLATPDTAFSCNTGKATGAYSHAEGRDCQAKAANSHAQGRSCICNGEGHAQGYACVINNSVNYAHVQGQSCVAAGSRQHVAGKYNKTIVNVARITGNGNSNTRSNCQVLDWDGNLWISGHLRSAGSPIMDYSDSVALQQGVIYKHTLQQSDSIVLDTSAFTSSRQVSFELHLTQPSTAVTFTWPANIVWGDGTYFGSANPPPDMNIASTVYIIVFRWDGQQLLGNLAYIKDAAE